MTIWRTRVAIDRWRVSVDDGSRVTIDRGRVPGARVRALVSTAWTRVAANRRWTNYLATVLLSIGQRAVLMVLVLLMLLMLLMLLLLEMVMVLLVRLSLEESGS